MRTLLWLIPIFTVATSSVAQNLLTFSKKTKPETTFSIKLELESVSIKPFDEKSFEAVLIEFQDSLLTVRCVPRNRKLLKANRRKFQELCQSCLTKEQFDSVYFKTIYSDLRTYHVNQLKCISVSLEHRPERKGLRIATHLTFGTLAGASILSLASKSPAAMIATSTTFFLMLIPEIILPVKDLSMSKWQFTEVVQ